MLTKLVIAWSLLAISVTIHVMGLIAAFRWLKRRPGNIEGRFWPSTWLLICVAGWVLTLHLMQIAVWACTYVWQGAMPDLATAFYFSGVTYTTTGYGDLVLPPEWRLVGAIEAMTGILMCGLSTGLFFAVFTTVFALNRLKEPKLSHED